MDCQGMFCWVEYAVYEGMWQHQYHRNIERMRFSVILHSKDHYYRQNAMWRQYKFWVEGQVTEAEQYLEFQTGNQCWGLFQ